MNRVHSQFKNIYKVYKADNVQSGHVISNPTSGLYVRRDCRSFRKTTVQDTTDPPRP
jgi:hypothetical protein